MILPMVGVAMVRIPNRPDSRSTNGFNFSLPRLGNCSLWERMYETSLGSIIMDRIRCGRVVVGIREVR